MARTETVICDICGKDITHTGNCEDWRIVLMSEPIPNPHQISTCMAIPPQIEKPQYFCSTRMFISLGRQREVGIGIDGGGIENDVYCQV